jgi:hypothetical protein
MAASAIILNLCIGPPLFRAAIISLGEGRSSANRRPELESPQAKHWELSVSGRGELQRESSSGMGVMAKHREHAVSGRGELQRESSSGAGVVAQWAR